MRKKIFFCLITSLIWIDSSASRKAKGYIITNSNDTMWVVFKIPTVPMSSKPNLEIIHWKIKYKNTENKTQVLRASMAREVAFTYRGKKYRFLSVDNTLNLGSNLFVPERNKLFLLLVKDGPVKQFSYYQTQYSSGVSTATGGDLGSSKMKITTVLKKNDSPAVIINTRHNAEFKQDVASYFSDCRYILSKNEQSTYHPEDLSQIIDEYLTNCR